MMAERKQAMLWKISSFVRPQKEKRVARTIQSEQLFFHAVFFSSDHHSMRCGWVEFPTHRFSSPQPHLDGLVGNRGRRNHADRNPTSTHFRCFLLSSLSLVRDRRCLAMQRLLLLSFPSVHSFQCQSNIPLACCQVKAKVRFPSVQTPIEPFAPALRQCHCTLQDSVLVGINRVAC